MQWSDDFDKQPSHKPINPLKRRRGVWRFVAMSCLAPVVGLVLVIGVCAFTAAVFRPVTSMIASRAGAIRTPLPRLTATALPTLTPTISPAQGTNGEAAVASAFSPAAAAPSNGSRAAQSQPATHGGAVAPPAQPGQTGAASSAYASTANSNPAAGAHRPAVNSLQTSAPVAPTAPPAVGQPGNEVVIILPTTSPPTSTPTPTPSPTKTSAPTPTPRPVDSVLDDDSGSDDEEEETVESINWSFSGVRADTSQYQNGMLVYGNLINQSATAQEIEVVNATFYDTGGNIIGEENYIQAYWPAYAVPPAGASMPFQLLVNGLSGAADFDLSLDANESSNTPRQDFEFSDLEESYQSNSYCVDGHLHNGGSQVEDYLIIAVVLYDGKDNVINFQDEQVYNPAQVVGDQAYHFKICVAPPYDDVARYDVQAWGY